MIDESWEKEKASYKTLFYSVLERHTQIVDIKNEADGLGYTDETGKIHIAKKHPYFSRLKAESRAFFRKGVFAHEMLHQCFTDFTYMKKIQDSGKYDYRELQIIMHFINLIEDPAIEYQAPCAFGGSLLDALHYTIARIYKMSPGIETSAGPFEELNNALINFGDMGIIKGHFTSPEAFEAFKKMAPEFNAAIFESVSSKRMDMAVKWMNDTRPLWESETSEDLKKMLSKIEAQNGISKAKGSGKPAMPIDAEDIDACKDTVSKSSIADKRADVVKAIESGEDVDFCEKDKAEADKEAMKTAKKTSKTPTGAAKTAMPSNGLDIAYTDEHFECRNNRVTTSDVSQYNAIVGRNSAAIKALKNSLKRIFVEDTGELCRKTAGKYNLVRGAVGTTVKVFDKYTSPKGLKDMAVFVLVDESGSMFGHKIEVARETAVTLAEVFSGLHIPYYIMGFTSEMSRPDVIHAHYVTWNGNLNERASLTKIAAKRNNNDAYSIKYASEALRKFNAEHKLLLVLSDGVPAAVGCSGTQGIKDTAMSVKMAKKAMSVLGLGISICESELTNMKTIYGNEFVNVECVDDLGKVLAANLKRVIRSW